MGKIIMRAVVLMLVCLSVCAQADVKRLENGGFEADGTYINDILVTNPVGWDVNSVSAKMGGWVYDDWVTEGSYNLTLFSRSFYTFEVNDMVTLEQDVYLRDVNEIYFDLWLDTDYGEDWDPNLRSVFVKLDDEVVWESPKDGSDIRGYYYDNFIDVNNDDSGLHRFTIGLRSDANEVSSYIDYYAMVDKIEFALLCDFDKSGVVDFYDYALLVNFWGEEILAESEYNLSHVNDVGEFGVIDMWDVEFFMQDWLMSSYKH